MAELNVQYQKLIKELGMFYPESKSYSYEQLLTIFNQQLGNVQLSENERVSIMSGRNGFSNDGAGLRVETTQAVELTKEKKKELLSAITKRINDVIANTKKAEDANGFLGKAWNWAKNTGGFGASSDKIRDLQKEDLKALESGKLSEAFAKITGLEYSEDNLNKFLNNEILTKSEQALAGYKEGQDMASDVMADIASGIAAVGIYTAAVAAAPFTGGASIAVGTAAAAAGGAAIKTGIKYADTVSSEKEYTSDNLKRDLATGAFSGVLAPIAGGMGGAVGKTVATKMGVQAVKQVGKEVADTVVESGIKQGIKTALTNPTGYEYVGGTVLKRSLAFGAEMTTDGAIGGAVDNAFRTAYDGGSLEDIGNSAIGGFVGGAIMAPIIGGGMKFAGKGAQKVFGKDNVQIDANGKKVLVTEDGNVIKYDDTPTAQAKAEATADLAGLVQELPPENPTTLKPEVQWRTETGEIKPNVFESADGFTSLSRGVDQTLSQLDKASKRLTETGEIKPKAVGSTEGFTSLSMGADQTLSQFAETAKRLKFSLFGSTDGFKDLPKGADKILSRIREYSKRLTVQKATRFTDLELDKLLAEINTPFIQSNKDVVKNILKKMSERSEPGVSYRFYEFDEKELVRVLKIVDEKNLNLLEMMLETRTDKGYTFSGTDFADILKVLSKHDNERAKNIIKLLSKKDLNQTGDIDIATQIKNLAAMSERYPEEFAILSSDYNPNTAERFFLDKGVAIIPLFKKLKTATPEQKELIKVVCSASTPTGMQEARFLVYLLDFVDGLNGLNHKQLLTLCKNFNESGGCTIVEAFQKLKSTIGKKLNFDQIPVYKKNPLTLTSKDVIEYMRKLGFSEEDCRILANYENSTLYVHLIELKDVVDPENSSIINKKNFYNYVIKEIKNGRKPIEELESCKYLFPYLTKENWELYKRANSEAKLALFVAALEKDVEKIESVSSCKLVSELTGKMIYEHELSLMGREVRGLCNLQEADIVAGVQKLKDLNLLTDDSNILTMLAKFEDLKNIEITPDVKDFAQTLLKNKYIEEGTLIELLGSIQGKTSEIRSAKIDFIKKMLANTNVNQLDISKITKNLSNEDLSILQKQVLMLDELSKENYRHLALCSEFLSANSIEELNTYSALLNKLKKMSLNEKIPSKNAFDIISSLTAPKFKNNKASIVDSIDTLLDKKLRLYSISRLIRDALEYDESKQKEFFNIYIKGLEQGLDEDLIDSCTDIIRLHLTEINSLNIKERLGLYDKINRLNDVKKDAIKQLGLDYDALYDKVVNSLGEKRHLVQVPKSNNQGFLKMVIANNNPVAEKVLREFDFAQFGKEGIPLKYSRKKFNLNIENLLKELSEAEKEVLLKHFGLVKGDAGFEGILNNLPFENKTVSTQARKIAQKIQKEIENFTINNEVMISDKTAKEMLDGLIKGLPEFASIVGKEQHGTHAYSVDIHTLKVLQSAMNNPLYKQLDNREKTILKYSILFHDLGKKGGVVDKEHAALSADYAWSILDRYPYPQTMKDRIIDIVDNHHWFERYNMGTATAENVAVRCRRAEDIKIYEIFSKADFENVNENFHLGSNSGGSTTQAEFDAYMAEKFKPIEDAVNKIYQKANLVFDTQFMEHAPSFPRQKVKLDGQLEELKVLNFADIADDESLFQYGFAPNVTKENARFLVHVTEPEYDALETVFRLTDNPALQSAWSTSLIKASNNRTYCCKPYGVILEAPHSNISEAFFQNSGSGYEKGLDAFQDFLFGSRSFKDGGITYDVRHFVKNNFIKEMEAKGYNLTDLDYAGISQYLFNKKYLSQITSDIKVGGKVINAQDLINALEKSRDTLFEGGNIHNEILPINPKVKGVIAKVEKLEDCPSDLLRFAEEHDLPIILMKPTDKLPNQKY